MKIYCASDMHIGYEQSNYQKIREFFELVKTEADELILCGDIFDLWRCNIDKIKDEKFLGGDPKSTYDALISVAHEIPTTIIFGNHDYKLWKELNLPIRVTDDFIYNEIYFCHGWRFSLEQKIGSFAYGGLVKEFPYLYQTFFKTPYETKEEEKQFSKASEMAHRAAKNYMRKNHEHIKCLVMGHTHDPFEDGTLFDCGDMIDSLSYVIIDNGKSELKKMPRD